MAFREQTPVAGPETQQLLHKGQQGLDEPALESEHFWFAPEYLQRLDENVKDLLLLPSHYAREDYIHWLRDLKRSDGRDLLKHKIGQECLLREIRWYEKRHRQQAPAPVKRWWRSMSAEEAVEQDIRNRLHQIYLSNMDTFSVHQTAWLEGQPESDEGTDDTQAYTQAQ